MNKILFLIASVLIFSGGILLPASAQRIMISMKNGTESQEYFSKVHKMTFTDLDLQVVYNSGQVNPYALTDIRKIYFFSDLTATGESGSSTRELHLCPNPASLVMSVSGIPQGTTKVEIFNLTGRKVMTLSVENEKETIDISGLVSGLYLLKASDLTAKFIKQ